MSIVARKEMRAMARPLVVAGGLALAAGCIAIPLGHREGAPAMSRKVVVRKQEPNILVAADRTWCEADPKKFRSAKVGDKVWCVWKQ